MHKIPSFEEHNTKRRVLHMKQNDKVKNIVKDNNEKELDTMLAFGAVGLGLGVNLIGERTTRSRLEGDLKSKIK